MRKYSTLEWILGFALTLFCVAFLWWVWPGPQLRDANARPAPVVETAPTRDPMIVDLATQVAKLAAQSPAVVNQLPADIATQPAVTAAPEANVPVAKQALVLPDAAMPLLTANGQPKGYALILVNKGPAEVSVPEGGFTFVALGNGKVGPVEAKSDGTVGNIVLFMGTNADDSTPKDLNTTVSISDYTTGNVAVTTVWFGEDGQVAAKNAVAGMFSAPNCGQEGCLTVNLYTVWPNGQVDKVTFTSPPK